jgi:nucleoside-triphosphatase
VPLANVRSTSKIRVGRYGVVLPEFERLLTEEFGQPGIDADVVVIDEIGKMECYSPMFVETVRGLLGGPTPLLATIAQRGTGFIRDVKERTDVQLLAVTTANRDRLPEQLAERLKAERSG